MEFKELEISAKGYEKAKIEWCNKVNRGILYIYPNKHSNQWFSVCCDYWKGLNPKIKGCKCDEQEHVIYLYINGKRIESKY